MPAKKVTKKAAAKPAMKMKRSLPVTKTAAMAMKVKTVPTKVKAMPEPSTFSAVPVKVVAKKAEPKPVFEKAEVKSGFSLRQGGRDRQWLRSLSLGPQFLIAGSAIALLLLLANVDKATFATRPSGAQGFADVLGGPMAIGLEHDEQASVTMLLAKKDGAGYASVSNESDVPLYISLPADWKRTEVSGAKLEDVKSEIPVFGFKRWTLPSKAAMKLELPSAPSLVVFDNSSPSVAMIDLTTVDLALRSAQNKVVLVQTQTNVDLWTTEE